MKSFKDAMRQLEDAPEAAIKQLPQAKIYSGADVTYSVPCYIIRSYDELIKIPN